MKMTKVSFIIISLLISHSAFCQEFFNVINYGAKGDGKTINTTSIQKAIDDVNKKGGGKLYFPNGIFITGTIFLKSNVTIYLSVGAVLKGSANLSDYPDIKSKVPTRIENIIGSTKKALLYAEDAENIGITGEGTFYPGGDQEIFQDHIDESPNRPYGLKFVNCNYVTVSNIHMKNSAYWMQRYVHCDHVRLTGLKIWNHCNLNNDGMDIDGCHDVTISDCFVDSSDDGICLKSEGNRTCEDVVITNCVVSSFASGIKLGTGSLGGFKRIAISNCVVRPTKAKVMSHNTGNLGGLAGIDIAEVDGALTEYVSVNNIIIDSAETPIFIRLGNRNGKTFKDDPTPKKSVMRHIYLSNIHAKNAGTIASAFTGFENNYIENLHLENITIESNGGGTDRDTSTQIPEYSTGYPVNRMFGSNLPAYGFYFKHIKGLFLNNITLSLTQKDQRPAIVYDDVKGLKAKDIHADFNSDLPLKKFYTVGDASEKTSKPLKAIASRVPPADSALIAYWSFDELNGNKVKGKTGEISEGSIKNAESAEGIKGKAIRFLKGGCIDFGNEPMRNIGPDITVAFWMKLDNPASKNYYRILAKRKAWDAPEGFEIEISPGNKRFNISGGNTNMKDQGLAQVSYDDQWHLYIATISDKRMRLYIDGKLIGWDDMVAPPSNADIPFVIGANSFCKDNLEGALDELKIWNRTLNSDEIIRLQNLK